MSEPPTYQPVPPQPGDDGEGRTSAVPQQVTRAAWSLYGLAALQIIGLVFNILVTGDTARSIRQQDPTLSDGEVSTLVTIGTVLSSIVTAAIAGMWILAARKVLAGRSWARILGTVLTGLVLVLDALAVADGALTGGRDGLGAIVTLLGLVLAGAYLLLAWSRPANEYFTATAAPR